MLNFRTTTIALLIFAALVLILLFFNIRLGMFPILAIIIWLILLIYGSVNICSGFYIKAFYKGKTSEKLITLTFDDGPDEIITPKVLVILEKYNIPATFFIIGQKAEKQVDLIQLIIARGHLIGLHSYSHAFFFDLYRRGKMEQDLLKTAEVMMKATGKRPLLFRPPYGVTNPTLAKVVKKLGYQVIGWSIRSLDTTIKDAEKVAGRVIGKLHPGAIILMHDTRGNTPEALEKLIIRAAEKGYRFAGLDEVLDVEAYKNY
jgi:peptidoglycan/xylan/chitin deacetylase (PgdA/CDA1 family)